MATLYWYGGTGNWTDYTNHWSNNSGNAPASPAAAEPSTTDDVVFDQLSSAANAAYTVNVNSSTATCRNFTMDGPSPADATKVTLNNTTATDALHIYGNFDLIGLAAGITSTYGPGYLYFNGTTGTKTINFRDIVNIRPCFDGVGATFQLAAALTLSSTNTVAPYLPILALTSGSTFDPNGFAVSLTATTGTTIIDGAFTFYSLSRSQATAITAEILFTSNIIVTNSLSLLGIANAASAQYRLLIGSTVVGTPISITTTGASVTITAADFRDITAIGTAGQWNFSNEITYPTGFGDCGGNSGMSLTAPVSLWWRAGTGSVNSITNWYSNVSYNDPKGFLHPRPPLPQDTAIFDSLSFTAGSQTITQNRARMGSIIFDKVTNSPTFTTSTICGCYGSIKLDSSITLTGSSQAYTFYGIVKNYLNSAGKSWAKPITFNNINAPMVLESSFTTSGALVVAGIFDANDFDITSTSTFSLCPNSTNKVYMGNGKWETSAATTVTVVVGSGTLYAEKSTLKLTSASTAKITGNGKTFYNLWTTMAGGALTIDGSNTYNNLTMVANGYIIFETSTTQTFNSINAIGAVANVVTLTGDGVTLVKNGSGWISGCDYVNIGGSTVEMAATPTDTWYLGPNSQEINAGITGVYFSNKATPLPPFFNL
jgi:hypothetical protein